MYSILIYIVYRKIYTDSSIRVSSVYIICIQCIEHIIYIIYIKYPYMTMSLYIRYIENLNYSVIHFRHELKDRVKDALSFGKNRIFLDLFLKEPGASLTTFGLP